MSPHGVPPSTVSRAFELARSGEYRTLQGIRDRLKSEGCAGVAAHLQGRTIQRELRALCIAAAAQRARAAAAGHSDAL